jgi:CHASE3 domain
MGEPVGLQEGAGTGRDPALVPAGSHRFHGPDAQESREDYRWSSQTKVVLAEVESTSRRLVEAHSDMRGYIITSEPAFAHPIREWGVVESDLGAARSATGSQD